MERKRKVVRKDSFSNRNIEGEVADVLRKITQIAPFRHWAKSKDVTIVINVGGARWTYVLEPASEKCDSCGQELP